MLDGFIKGVIRYRWAVILLSLALVGLIGKEAGQLTIKSSTRVFFDGEFKQLVETDLLEETFDRNKNLSIAVVPSEGTIYTEKYLKLIHEMTERAWDIPYAARVNSITNYQHTSVEGDDLMVDNLLPDPDGLTLESIAAIKAVALREHDLNSRLVSESGDMAVIDIKFELPYIDDLQEYLLEIITYTDAFLAEYPESEIEASFKQAGDVYLNYNLAFLMAEDMSVMSPVVLVIITVFLLFLFRSILATIATLIIVVSSVGVTLGIFGWLGYYMTTPTSMVPVVIMTLAVADAVHVITSMLVKIKHGTSRRDALRESFHLNLKPVFITSITTAAGMLTLNFAESPVFRDLGNMVAVGVMVAFVLSVILLPALLAVMPIKSAISDVNNTGMDKLGDWVVRHPGKIFIFYGLFAIALSAASSLNEVNDEADRYLRESTEARQSIEFFREHMSGSTLMDIGVFSGIEDHISSPDYLYKLEAFSSWLRSHPSVAHVFTMSDTFKRLNQNMHGGDEAWYRIPDSKALAAQYLLLYEMSLPVGLDINNQVDLDKSATRIYVLLDKTLSRDQVALEGDIMEWFRLNAADLEPHMGGSALMFATVGEKNIPSTLKGLGVAILVISLLLVAALRSWKLGIVSLLPNFLPIAMGMGVWGLVSGEVNLGISLVASIAIGIVVDDSVHFLSKYQQAKSEGMSTEEAIRYSFTTVGRALLTTTIVLASGFAVLLVSNFVLLSGMGLVTSVVVVFALVTDFLLLPAVLILLDRFLHRLKNKSSLEETVAKL